MFDGLFDFIKTIFVIAVIVVVVAIVLFIVWLVRDAKKVEEHNRKVDEQKRQDEAFLERRRKYYLEGLHQIYDHRSTAQLLKIYEYLRIMHYNDYTSGIDDECTPATVDAYQDASEKLISLLGNPVPQWRWMNKSRNFSVNHPALVTEDMNYVYNLIQSRN